MPDRISKLLRDIKLFDNLTEIEFKQLCSAVTTIKFKNNEVIYKEEQDITHLIYSVNGLVKIYKTEESNYKLVNIITKLNFIDIISSIYYKKYRYTAIAAGKSTQLYYININVIKELKYKNINFVNDLLTKVCETISLFHSFKNDILYKQVKPKVAYALIYFESVLFDDDNNLVISKHELADLLYIAHENLSRTLKEFSNDKLIEIKGKSIKILNQKLLLKICNS
ncbi:MAG: hypothetical protein A2033_13220 [Bacteroidetes bacterium GWA2_31_9]|nr:MAG: hypothetical protein A2033_13220 [Bacteroidetes bacterium GWA2_31_9]